MDYQPKPKALDHIQLPQGWQEDLETIARNTHEVWASERMRDGWTYGAQYDEANKKHPCLVPYDELPENEKQYDRNTSQMAIKMLLSMGYRIAKTEEDFHA